MGLEKSLEAEDLEKSLYKNKFDKYITKSFYGVCHLFAFAFGLNAIYHLYNGITTSNSNDYFMVISNLLGSAFLENMVFLEKRRRIRKAFYESIEELCKAVEKDKKRLEQLSENIIDV